MKTQQDINICKPERHLSPEPNNVGILTLRLLASRTYFSVTYPCFNIFVFFCFWNEPSITKYQTTLKNASHWHVMEKPTNKDRYQQQVAKGGKWLKQWLANVHRKLKLSNRLCPNLAQVTLVTTLVGGLSVFGFRFYTAIQFLPVKNSWLAPITGWPEGTWPVY